MPEIMTEAQKRAVEVEEGRNAMVRKDNTLITAKYKSPLLENQLTSICISRAKEQNGEYIATVTSSELRHLFSLNDSNSKIYKRLYSVAKNMAGRTISAEDGHGNFSVISVIQEARYKDGVFSVLFSKKMKPLLFDLQGKYTSYALANILNFKSDYSFRIYEIIRKEAFRITKTVPVVTVGYGLSEFKCMIGMVNMESDRIKKALQENPIDWDRIVEMAPEKSYENWTDFRRYVINKARDEIRSQCDVCFDYSPVKEGQGSRVVGIKLFIMKNDVINHDVNIKEEGIKKLNEEYADSPYKPSPELVEMIGHNELKKSDLMMFLKDAGGDNELVLEAIKKADGQERVNNYIGWIRSCIRSGGYKDTDIPVESGSSEVARQSDALNAEIEKDADKFAASYWKRVKDGGQEKFKEFSDFLVSNNFTVDMFEAMYSPAECGEIFIKWVKGEKIILM